MDVEMPRTSQAKFDVCNPGAPPGVDNPTDIDGGEAGGARETRSTTEIAVNMRLQDGGAALVSKRIEVDGKGVGTVIGQQKSKGKPTEHTIEFDDGKRETILLSKDPTAANAKGHKFWLLQDTVQVRATPSRSHA